MVELVSVSLSKSSTMNRYFSYTKYFKTSVKHNLSTFALALLSALFFTSLISCNKDIDVPEDGDVVIYKIGGTFSVAADKQVAFSQGNLQYNAVAHTWRFAEYQYDCVGASNASIGSHYDGWIDLFGWGTSGFMIAPYCASTDVNDYSNNGEGAEDNNYDWGRFNSISNSIDGARIWRTLSAAEWEYLLQERENAERKYGLAVVCDQPGLVLLSDYFSVPARCTFVPGFEYEFQTNIYNQEQWEKMEAAGAIFLPAAGYRIGTTVDEVSLYGAYWSSSFGDDGKAYTMGFDIYQISLPLTSVQAYYGQSVRLVRDVVAN